MRIRTLLLALFLLTGLGGLAGASPLMPSAAVTTALDQPSTVETVRWRDTAIGTAATGIAAMAPPPPLSPPLASPAPLAPSPPLRAPPCRRHRHTVRRLHFSRPAAARPARWIEPR